MDANRSSIQGFTEHIANIHADLAASGEQIIILHSHEGNNCIMFIVAARCGDVFTF